MQCWYIILGLYESRGCRLTFLIMQDVRETIENCDTHILLSNPSKFVNGLRNVVKCISGAASIGILHRDISPSNICIVVAVHWRLIQQHWAFVILSL